MVWTRERRREVAIAAPLGDRMLRDGTVVVERPGWYQVITPSSLGSNEVAFSQVEPEDAERVIDEVVARYRSHGLPTKWCVGPWTRPDDFGERLERRGFAHWDVRGMGCDTSLPVP